MANQIVGGRAKSTAHCMNETTAIDCQKQVRSWRLVRSYMELLVPSCGCYCPEERNQEEEEEEEERNRRREKFSKTSSVLTQIPKHVVELPTIVTGTIFGFRHGKVSLCIQANHRTAPIVLLGLAVPSAVLAREMLSGLLRIALHCNYFNINNNARNGGISTSRPRSLPPLVSMPLWTVYCNGRKAGFAVKRRPTKSDMEVLRLMQSVPVGAGSINPNLLSYEDDELIYLRANFERVSGFAHSLSFHLINPDSTSTGQELSIFFLRS
ncbi:hypothetical protein H6P81_010708 [Aristolochia fimbriata]|uniref:Protein MIZU-KUSSEI 1 n=1 Tax=Aristolochia fimbriata TaxID=158543 RepID=A0AAV7EPJ1_ARIFI|nr:hypothetical protein H6P81_010708 [Aristolochia fimbriata]